MKKAPNSKKAGYSRRTWVKWSIAGPETSLKSGCHDSATRNPTTASMATRPCWVSASRYRRSSPPSTSERPRGSQGPVGARTPGKPSQKPGSVNAKTDVDEEARGVLTGAVVNAAAEVRSSNFIMLLLFPASLFPVRSASSSRRFRLLARRALSTSLQLHLTVTSKALEGLQGLTPRRKGKERKSWGVFGNLCKTLVVCLSDPPFLETMLPSGGRAMLREGRVWDWRRGRRRRSGGGGGTP
mmetsp:Transcript_2917/g.9733  ORF Transcript_2917/g.9733 Transcript_2917/m.9733 type:complete len:241 (+) Transcript_2917:74-796(+)